MWSWSSTSTSKVAGEKMRNRLEREADEAKQQLFEPEAYKGKMEGKFEQTDVVRLLSQAKHSSLAFDQSFTPDVPLT